MTTQIHLKGWTHSLDDTTIEAIKNNLLQIKKEKDYEYLVGTYINKQGLKVTFLS
jgi:hypothetical protein